MTTKMRVALLAASFVGLAACSSSSPGVAMIACTPPPSSPEAGANPEGGVIAQVPPPCSSGLVCMTFAATAADDLCGSGGTACVLPCTTDSDCAPLGKGVSCSSACGPQICTPYQ